MRAGWGLLLVACSGSADPPSGDGVPSDVSHPTDVTDATDAPSDTDASTDIIPGDTDPPVYVDAWVCETMDGPTNVVYAAPYATEAAPEIAPLTDTPWEVVMSTGVPSYVRLELDVSREYVIYVDRPDVLVGVLHWGQPSTLQPVSHDFLPCPDDVVHIHQSLGVGTWHLELHSQGANRVRLMLLDAAVHSDIPESAQGSGE